MRRLSDQQHCKDLSLAYVTACSINKNVLLTQYILPPCLAMHKRLHLDCLLNKKFWRSKQNI